MSKFNQKNIKHFLGSLVFGAITGVSSGAVAEESMRTTAAQLAPTKIICVSRGGSSFSIDFGARRQFNRPLNCLNGNFTVDMTPCAPTNGYGLSAPTGSAALVGVATRREQFANHMGGVMYSEVNHEMIQFSGGFHAPGQSYREDWTVDILRVAKVATLTRAGRRSENFTCSNRTR